jgi:hypothetical protein
VGNAFGDGVQGKAMFFFLNRKSQENIIVGGLHVLSPFQIVGHF